MDKIGLSVTGFNELARELERMPVKMQRNAVRGALRKGTQQFQLAIEQDAPVRRGFKTLWIGKKKDGRARFPGFLSRNIKMKKVRPSNLGTGQEAYWTAPKRDAFYGSILALGGRFGRWHLAPTGWMDRAYKRMDDAVLREFERTIAAYLARWAKQTNSETKSGAKKK